MDASGNVQGIKAALEGIQSLKVADYQRDFSWDHAQVDDLWNDVLYLLEEDSEGQHFLGTLILQKPEDDSKDRAYELVDGQQRLTTVFMFASVLLDFAKLHPTRSLQLKNGRTFNVAQELENFLLGQPETSEGVRLIPLIFLQRTFRVITDIGLTRSERLKAAPRKAKSGDKSAPITLPLRRAYNHIDQKLLEYFTGLDPVSDKHLEAVQRVSRVFLDQLKVLKLVTNDLGDSLDVFMTLNNRGTPLGVFDLFRGEVLKVRISGADSNERDELFFESINEWNTLMENLGGFSADKYLRHFALTKNFERDPSTAKLKIKPLTLKALPTWTSEYLSKTGDQVTAAERLWSEAVRKSEDYGGLLKPTGRNFSDYYLEALKLIGDSYRVLLLGLDLRDDSIWTQASRTEVLKAVYELVLKWTLANKNAQELEGKFQRMAIEFAQADEYQRIKSLLRSINDESNFSLDYSTQLSGEIDPMLGKSIMLIIEANLTPSSIKVDLEKVQLEHIAPQKHTEGWLSSLGVEQDAYASHVQKLGNMVDLDSPINPKIKQDLFPQKVIEYKKSRVATVRDLEYVSNWSLRHIDSRTAWAIEQIQDVFGGKEVCHFSQWDGLDL